MAQAPLGLPGDCGGDGRAVEMTDSGSYIGIDELEVYAPGSSAVPWGMTLVQSSGTNGSAVPNNLALQSNGSTAFAKDLLPGYTAHSIPHLNDGVYGNSDSWIGNSSPTFAGVAFSSPQTIDEIAFGRDNTGDRIRTATPAHTH